MGQIQKKYLTDSFCGTNTEEIFKCLSAVDKKAVGFDAIFLKLVKMAASVFCQPLSNAINCNK